MLLLVVCELLEQVLRHAVVDRDAIGRRLEIERARLHLGFEIGAQHLLDRFADAQRIEALHVREAFEEQDARHELVGVCISSIDSSRHFLARSR